MGLEIFSRFVQWLLAGVSGRSVPSVIYLSTRSENSSLFEKVRRNNNEAWLGFYFESFNYFGQGSIERGVRVLLSPRCLKYSKIKSFLRFFWLWIAVRWRKIMNFNVINWILSHFSVVDYVFRKLIRSSRSFWWTNHFYVIIIEILWLMIFRLPQKRLKIDILFRDKLGLYCTL